MKRLMVVYIGGVLGLGGGIASELLSASAVVDVTWSIIFWWFVAGMSIGSILAIAQESTSVVGREILLKRSILVTLVIGLIIGGIAYVIFGNRDPWIAGFFSIIIVAFFLISTINHMSDSSAFHDHAEERTNNGDRDEASVTHRVELAQGQGPPKVGSGFTLGCFTFLLSGVVVLLATAAGGGLGFVVGGIIAFIFVAMWAGHREAKMEAYKDYWREQREQADIINIFRTRSIDQNTKHAVFLRDGGRCQTCYSQKNLEYDHIIPFSFGGANTKENIQLLCRTCNRRKGNTVPAPE